VINHRQNTVNTAWKRWKETKSDLSFVTCRLRTIHWQQQNRLLRVKAGTFVAMATGSAVISQLS